MIVFQEISKHHIILVNGVTNFPLTAVLAFAVVEESVLF